MKNKIIKMMTAFVAASSCLLAVSCKDKKSSYEDNSYKSGSNKTIAKVLEDLSKENDQYETNDNLAKSVTVYTTSLKNINNYYYEIEKSPSIYLCRFTDSKQLCEVTNSYSYGKVNDYSVYNRVNTGNKCTIDSTEYSIYKTTIYGHVVNDIEKYDFEVSYYSLAGSRAPTYSIKDDKITINQGIFVISTTTDFTKKDSEITLTFTKENLVKTGEDEEDIDYEKAYKYNGYTYAEELNQYIKITSSGDYKIVYHKDEKGKDLKTFSINQNAYFNYSTFVWQEDIILGEKNDETDFTYYDESGNKHLLKTYCSTLDGKKDAVEIKTEFKFDSEVAVSENYLVLTGQTINSNKVLSNRTRTYFLDNDADVVYKTLINEDYSNVVKVSDKVYNVNGKLFDSKLNYLDSVSYQSVQNAFTSSTALYDLTGNVIATGSYSMKNGAIYDNVNEKYYSLINNNLVEYSGKYYANNTYYNLDITVTNLGALYRYDFKSLDGTTSATIYSEKENVTFNYSKCDTVLKVTSGTVLYDDTSKTTKLSMLVFSF